MRFTAAVVASVSLLAAAPAIADSCSDILKDGVFDSIFSNQSTTTAQQLNQWLKTATYSEVKDKVDAGVTIPIDGFPVGGKFSEDSFKKFQQSLDQGTISGFNEATAQQFVQKNASPVIVNAWLQCMQGLGAGVHLSATVNTSAPDQIAIAARFSPFDETTKPPTITSFSASGNAVASGGNPLQPGAKLGFQPMTAIYTRAKTADGYPGVTFVINTTNGSATEQVPASSTNLPMPPLTAQVFPGPLSASASHPEATATVPAGYKVVGGGAVVNWTGGGNLLTASYPSDARTWTARAKDHDVVSPATLQAFAIGLYDPDDKWDVRIFTKNSDPAQHPEVQVAVDPQYVMTGGGAIANWAQFGSLLTASYPASTNVWIARSKDHRVAESVVLTGYAIGIRPKNGAALPLSQVASNFGSVEAHPSARVEVPAGFTMTGGGAFDDWRGYGNLLTAAYPSGNGYSAAGKDHETSDPARITAYVVGLKMPTMATPYALKINPFGQYSADWVRLTYRAPGAAAASPLIVGGRLAPGYLAVLRRAGPVANARIHWTPHFTYRPMTGRQRPGGRPPPR